MSWHCRTCRTPATMKGPTGGRVCVCPYRCLLGHDEIAFLPENVSQLPSKYLSRPGESIPPQRDRFFLAPRYFPASGGPRNRVPRKFLETTSEIIEIYDSSVILCVIVSPGEDYRRAFNFSSRCHPPPVLPAGYPQPGGGSIILLGKIGEYWRVYEARLRGLAEDLSRRRDLLETVFSIIALFASAMRPPVFEPLDPPISHPP